MFKSRWAEVAWKMLDDPVSGPKARLYTQIQTTVVMLSVLVTLLQTADDAPLSGVFAATLEVAFETFFLLEWGIRLFVTPNKSHFFRSFHNAVDLIVVMPIIPRAVAGFVFDGDHRSPIWIFLMDVTPVLRLLKTLRHFGTFKLMLGAFRLSSEAMPALLFTLAVMSLSFAAILHSVEPEENIPSFSSAIWLVLVTATTVGYGDMLPESTVGILVVSILIVSSVLYFAIPVGMVGHTFVEVWEDRDRILLTQVTRDRLEQWGYLASDVPTLFRNFDGNGDGLLDLHEFTRMVRHMGLRLSKERCLKLFELFDVDRSGVIDDTEFVRQMYPEDYHEVYDKKRKRHHRHDSH